MRGLTSEMEKTVQREETEEGDFNKEAILRYRLQIASFTWKVADEVVGARGVEWSRTWYGGDGGRYAVSE